MSAPYKLDRDLKLILQALQKVAVGLHGKMFGIPYFVSGLKVPLKVPRQCTHHEDYI
jgi:hypothetical protein